MRASILPIISLAALLILGWGIYRVGLGGTFLFDDFNNLHQLGDFGPVDNWKTFFLYLTSGEADPTGRPLSMLSFLIDANDWPADPEPFKRTSILLHLLNGVLLVWVLLKLGRALKLEERQAQIAAVLGGALWTLHPLFASTVLYVIQREAMLPVTFVLIGMLLWVAGRERFFSAGPWGLPFLVGGAWGCTLLALLCKGNGILLPLLLWVMDSVVPGRGDAAPERVRSFKRLRLVLLGLPIAMLAWWVAMRIPRPFFALVPNRSWSTWQRLITEPHVLSDYLGQLWIPKASLSGLFNDDYPASRDLLHPWSTLPALLFLSLLITLAITLRRRHPAAAFTILFFFAGQVLESSAVPLELYFEHRNYLPALPMFWPLALWLSAPDRSLPRVRMALAGVLPILFALLTHTRAGQWGTPYAQALLFAQASPDSPRAQVNAASYQAANGDFAGALTRLRRANDLFPNDPQVTLNLIDTECLAGPVSSETIEQTLKSIQTNTYEAEYIHNWIVKHIAEAADGACAGLDLDAMQKMHQAEQSNPYFSRAPGHHSDLLIEAGEIDLARGQGVDALRNFNQAMVLFPTPDGALLRAALLGGGGFPGLGLAHLEYYKTLPPGNRGLNGMAAVHLRLLTRDGFWSQEIDRLEQQLRADALTKQQAGPASQESNTPSTTTPQSKPQRHAGESRHPGPP